MKTEITMVAKDKSPLDILAELGDRTKNAWIYLHENAVNKLENECDGCEDLSHCISFMCNETEMHPKTMITINTDEIGCWKSICCIVADDIAFKGRNYSNPEEIFFLKMEE